MRKNNRIVAMICALVMCVALLTGCKGETAKEKDTFTVAIDSDIVKLDPAFAYDYTTNPVVNQITQGLFTFDQENQVQPVLAKSVTQVDDVTYVYEIRSDVNFSDGSKMTMEDVIFSLERTRNPEVASYLGWMYDNVDTIEQTGDWEMTITLKNPDATWQYILATSAGHVLSKAFVEETGDKLGTSEGGLLGTGPYKFVSWENGSKITLVKNENYWNDDVAHYDNLIFKVINEDTTRATAIQSGDVDATINPPLDLLGVIKEDKNLNLTSTSGFGVQFLAFNTQKEPFNNVDVRKAIAHAINFESIQTNLVLDAGETGTALPSSEALFTIETERWNDYNSSKKTLEYDVEKAKQLLADAGYADGFDATICVSNSNLPNSIVLAMQADLEKIGINITINKVTNDEHTNYQFGGVLDENGIRDYDMIFAGWEADYPDPSGNITPLFDGGNSANAAAYNNEKVNELIAGQMSESEPSVRNDLMFQALDIITEDVPYLYVYYPSKNLAMNKAYEGVYMNASWTWNMQFQNAKPVE